MRKTLLLLVMLSTASCAILEQAGTGVGSLYPSRRETTQEELRATLLDFSSTFGVLVTEAADRISAETTESRTRRLTLLWKIHMPPVAQDAASDPDPRSGYVEALTLSVAMRQYFEDGSGSSMFGPQQPIALSAAREIEERALALGSSFLSPELLKQLHEKVDQLASKHPIRGTFLRESFQAGLSKAESGGAFDEILSIPMAPFRAFAGVESGAQAIHEFNATAAQFTEIIDTLPQRIRWQAELLSYDLQERGGMLQQSLDSFGQMAESAQRLSVVAEQAPEDVRQTIVTISAELEQRSKILSSLLSEYHAAMTETSSAAAKMTGLVEALARTSAELNQAGDAWSGLAATLAAPRPAAPPGQPPARPFDILDYEKTAIALRSTAEEVRALLDDVQKTRGDLGVSLADRLLRNGVLLIAAFFVALLGYRGIVSRIPPARPRGGA